jgi:glycosyltransferase involved in cell wall biosynthesis
MKLLSDMTESLVSMGHEVTVLTGFPNWPSGKIYPGYRQRLVQRETVNGVHLIRIPLYPDHSTNSLKRAANFLSFALSAILIGPFVVPRVDVMHVIHPPITVGLSGWVLSRLRGLPFTLEIQDMWPENLRSTGMVRNELVLRFIGFLARRVYRRAKSIRVISRGFRLNLLEKRVPEQKIAVISNWVDTDYYCPLPPDPALQRRFGMADRFNILYAGTIGLAQGLDVVLVAADLLRSHDRIQFVLAGDGVEQNRLAEESRRLKLDNVKFLGRLPGDLMPSLYASADALLLHLKDDPLFEITIPHKLFTYLAAGKPVLAAAKGDVAEIVRSYDSGVVCAPGNPAELAAAALRLYQMAAEERQKLGNNGRKVATEMFNRGRMVSELSRVLEAAALGRERFA